MMSFQYTLRRLLGILVLTGSLLPHSPVQAQGLPPAVRPVPQPGVTRAVGVKTDTNRTVELKFNQATLDMVLQYYCSELTGRTLLQAPNVNAVITLRSQTELTIPEAIQAIKAVLAMNNIALVNQGDKFVKAVPITSASQEGLQIQTNQADQVIHPETDELVSEVVPLKFIDPAEAQKAITGLIHTYGKILPLERINSLMIADTAVNLNRIKDILTRIDQPLDIKESIHILIMHNSKPSDIKTKLEEIIADQKDKEKQPTVRRLNTSGAPGVDTTPATIPGVIRARSVMPAIGGTKAGGSDATDSDSGDDRMIRGNVKVIADDRTGTLIIITRQENMRFFEQVVSALDIGTAPDVTIEVIRLEYADAEEVASMLNALIGAATSTTSKSSPTKKTSTTSTTRPDGSPGATTSSTTTREEPRSSYQLQEFIDQQRQLSGAKGAEGKTKVGQLSAENIKILADKRTNGLILMASKGDMAALKDILKGMDVMLSQVLIEAVIMQVSLDKNLERGVDWVQRSMIAYDKTASGGRDPLFAFAGQGGGGKTVPINASSVNNSAGIGGAGGLTYYFTQFGLNIDAVIKMSQSDNRSKIIASPVILTTDNKEAKIDVSEERYFYKGVTYTGYTGTSGAQATPNVEARKVGLSLTVTPRINAKKFVVMEIAQKIENVNGTQTISDSSGNNEWPIVASREMNASVSVRSGETIILGGLVENNNTANKNGIPFLNKLPFLGFLFGSATDTGKRAEIVVFITPYVLDSPEEIETESARRKAALSADSAGLWEKGWSDSNLADPPQNRRGIKSLLK
ncbi:MAG: type II secretion system secretin GspD [bacterium]